MADPTPATTAPARPRILMLPGWAQSASTFRARISSLVDEIGDSAELVFVDPTHLLMMPTPTGTSSTPVPSDTTDLTLPYNAAAPRCWWFGDHAEGRLGYRGVDATIRRLRHILETQGPFDGVFGFSQGASGAALLTSLLEDPTQHPVFAAPGREGESWPPSPLKFAVMVAGFAALSDEGQRAVKRTVATPALLVVGRGDTVVSQERSLLLYEGFSNLRIEFHDGGHYVPNRPTWRHFLAACVATAAAHPTALLTNPGPGSAPRDPKGAKL